MIIEHITKPKDFAEVLKNGRRFSGRSFSLHCYKQESAGKAVKVGIIVSKKFSPLAVTRNFIRRRIYSFFDIHKDDLKSGTLLVVRLNRKVKGEPKGTIADAIKEDLTFLSEKAGIKK